MGNYIHWRLIEEDLGVIWTVRETIWIGDLEVSVLEDMGIIGIIWPEDLRVILIEDYWE